MMAQPPPPELPLLPAVVVVLLTVPLRWMVTVGTAVFVRPILTCPEYDPVVCPAMFSETMHEAPAASAMLLQPLLASLMVALLWLKITKPEGVTATLFGFVYVRFSVDEAEGATVGPVTVLDATFNPCPEVAFKARMEAGVPAVLTVKVASREMSCDEEYPKLI